MNDTRQTFSDKQVLGRVLTSQGEPLDGKGLLLTELLQHVDAEKTTPRLSGSLLEIGVKPVDLLAPLTYGGIISLFGIPGVGKLALVEEMMHNVIMHYNGYIVCVGMDEGSYEASELTDAIEELGMQDKIVLLFEQNTNNTTIHQRLVQFALTIVGHLRDQGHEVLLVADKQATTQCKLMEMPELKQIAYERGITTLLLRPGDEETIQREEQMVFHKLDGRIIFSQELAKQNLWPTVDRQRSSSRLLMDGIASREHIEIAQQVQQLLQQAQIVQTAENQLEQDQRLLKRVAIIQQFLTHPHFVAEQFTDKPGEFVPLTQTLSDIEVLLSGRYDDVPPEAFYLVGTVEQALTKANRQ